MPDAAGAAGRPDLPTNLPPGVTERPDGTRRFTNMSIGAAIDEAIKRELPEGRTLVVVAALDRTDGVNRQRLAVVVKKGDHFDAMGFLEHEDHKPLTYGAAVRWSM